MHVRWLLRFDVNFYCFLIHISRVCWNFVRSSWIFNVVLKKINDHFEASTARETFFSRRWISRASERTNYWSLIISMHFKRFSSFHVLLLCYVDFIPFFIILMFNNLRSFLSSYHQTKHRPKSKQDVLLPLVVFRVRARFFFFSLSAKYQKKKELVCWAMKKSPPPFGSTVGVVRSWGF